MVSFPFNPSPGQAKADRSERSRPSLRNKKYFFKTKFPCVDLVFMELTLYTRVASNSEIHVPSK